MIERAAGVSLKTANAEASRTPKAAQNVGLSYSADVPAQLAHPEDGE